MSSSPPINMKAIVATTSGPTLTTVPVSTPGPNHVLVKVHAAALNRADLGMLKGQSHGMLVARAPRWDLNGLARLHRSAKP